MLIYMISVVFWCAEEDRVESVLQNTLQNGGDALSNFGHVFFTGFQFFRPLLGNTPKCVIFCELTASSSRAVPAEKKTRHAHSPRNRPVLWKIWITAVETLETQEKCPRQALKHTNTSHLAHVPRDHDLHPRVVLVRHHGAPPHPDPAALAPAGGGVHAAAASF